MNKRVVAVAVAIAALFGGAYYGSPYWALHEMRMAAQAGEGDRLSGYVDFPAVRESLKSQMQAMLMKQMQTEEMKANPFAAFGVALAEGMINMMVDGMVTPESVASMVNNGKPKPADAKAAPLPADSPSNPQPKTDAASSPPRVDRHYEGLGVFKVELHEPQTDELMLTLVLNREGWFGWKLKAVRLSGLNPK